MGIEHLDWLVATKVTNSEDIDPPCANTTVKRHGLLLSEMFPRIGISCLADGSNPVKATLFPKIGEWAEVVTLDPETEHNDLLEYDLDLYHMVRRRAASLSDLERACRGGITTINPYVGARLFADRLNSSKVLRDAGLPVPTFQYGRPEHIDLDTPVILKPRYELGPTRHDISVISEDTIQFSGQKFVQEYVPHDRVYKIYQFGTETKAVEGTEATRQPTRECEVTDRLTAIADRIRQLTNMDLFEVDLVGGDDLYVVDVNAAVSARGIADGVAIYERLLYSKVHNTLSADPV